MRCLPVILCSALFFLLGIVICLWQYEPLSSLVGVRPIEKKSYSEMQIRQSGYRFISPLLECESSEDTVRSELSGFKADLEAQVAKLTTDTEISAVSVYFRDLNNGPWYGINENEAFTPASLLKMPLMIALLKQAEHDPTLLSRTIEFSPDLIKVSTKINQTIEPAEKLQVGTTYTIEELISRMIVYSDNESMYVLLNEIDEKVYDRVYADLGLRLPNVAVSENYMTVKDYASFFRILYNASYLNKDMSEMALKLLSSAAFTGGLVDGVPSNITVAHKFGERIHGPQNETQLHDCGIVYHSKVPYLLCVMTRGDTIDKESQVISEISKFVYQSVDTRSIK